MPTVFWWDTFDKNVDRAGGCGSIHFTPGMAFQEEVSGADFKKLNVNIDRSKRRSLKSNITEGELPVRINQKNIPNDLPI